MAEASDVHQFAARKRARLQLTEERMGLDKPNKRRHTKTPYNIELLTIVKAVKQ